ncbi:MAG TPA: tetratricopeptide repeat protein [Polyangiaceae bacterium]|nr:tetratricopeptide repeat protein [Polyangiaceae bacterium]
MSLLDTALLHQRAGNLGEAERLYREVLAHDPNRAEAAFYLGMLALQSARLDEAVEMLTRATALAPDNPACHANLGVALRRKGLFPAAMDSLATAMALNPDLVAPASNLAQILHEYGAAEGELACLEHAAGLEPSLSDLQTRLAAARAVVDRPATDTGGRDDRADMMSAVTLLALARPLAERGRLEDAGTLLRRAIGLQPRMAVLHGHLGLVQATLGQIGEAAASYRAAIEIEPDRADHHHDLANALLRGGRLDEAIGSFRQAVRLSPASAAYHSDLVFNLHFHPAYDSHRILAEARAYELAHAAPLTQGGRVRRWDRETDRTPDRRLRIGYLSPNFRQHCQVFFLAPLLDHHDHRAFEIFCYSDLRKPDSLTERLLSRADVARGVAGMSDAELVDRIEEDRIDILVDLTMHMGENRLLVFARRPAPLQLCWLAYPGTTGLSAMDYRITDPHLDPPDNGDAYAERPLRLPDTFWCYRPLTDDETVGPLPALQRGHVTFGSLNNFVKVRPEAVALWARVMRAVHRSTFTLMTPVGDARERVLVTFEEHGIDRARVTFVPYQPHQAYLATYRSIDVCLDTFPYNGHTTSLDASWMGVPVVTLVGSTVVGRAGLSLAANLGLPGLVARSPEEFVAIAVGLSADLDRLAVLRAGLRPRMESSPLMDAPRFARNLEAAYRSLWRSWCGDTA